MNYVPTHRVATHPGAFLQEEIEGRGLSVHGLAQDLGLPATRLHEIVHEQRGVSAGTAIALGAYFDQTPMFWLDAQKMHELSEELFDRGEEIRARVRRRAEATSTV